MHRTIDIGLPSEEARALLPNLRVAKGVGGLSHHAGTSILPMGDTVRLQVLNAGADGVLSLIAANAPHASVTTSEVASISDPAHRDAIKRDVDEAIWEEVETGLRHQGRVGLNFLLLMALGGVIGAAGALAEPAVAAVAYVAAAIVAPGFEPVAKMPLGLVLKRWEVVRIGAISTLAGYGALVVAAAITTWLLVVGGVTDQATFLERDALRHTVEPGALILTIAASGAVAGVVIQSAYRRSVIAGPLVALRLIEVASVIGISVAFGRVDLAWLGAQRLALDLAFVVVAGVVVFGLKQLFLHKRAPLD